MKQAIRSAILFACRISRRYTPFEEHELRTVRCEALPYIGDVPANSTGDEQCHVRYRHDFEVPREPRVSVRDLLYTDRGMAWVDGSLHQRYSVQAPRVMDLALRSLPRHASVLDRATIIHSYSPYTYGDWFLEHLSTLFLAGRIDSPLLLPRFILEREYVRRDLALLGLEAIPVDSPMLIREAVVLQKTIVSCHWTTREAAACRQAYRVEPVEARPGSIIYLCREGESAASVNRTHPHQLLVAVMEDLGIRVVRAASTTFEEYRSLATSAETVIADHGAAMCNLAFWGTKNVVELYSNTWWSAYFVFLGKALGVSNYALVSTDGLVASDHRALRAKIRAVVDELSYSDLPQGHRTIGAG